MYQMRILIKKYQIAYHHLILNINDLSLINTVTSRKNISKLSIIRQYKLDKVELFTDTFTDGIWDSMLQR